MPRLYFFENTAPLYYCYKCPECGKYNVGQMSLRSMVPALIGRANATKINKKTLIRQAEAVMSKKDVPLVESCYSCGRAPKWCRGGLRVFAAILRGLAITGLILGLGFAFYLRDNWMSTEQTVTVFAVCGGVALLSFLGCIGIDRSVRSRYKKLSEEYMPMVDVDPKRLYQRIQESLPPEVTENINSLKYTLLGHFHEC